MRILHVIPVFSPPRLFGGSQRVAYLLSKGLVKKGHEVVVYTSNMRNLEERTNKTVEIIDGISIVHFKDVSPFLFGRAGLNVTPGMVKGLNAEINGFDIIHVHEARSFQHIVIWLLARNKGVPYIVQTHGNLNEVFGGLPRLIYDDILGKRILRDSSAIIAVNKVEAHDFLRFGIPDDKVKILPNPVDIDEFNPQIVRGIFREKYSIKPDSKLVLFMGRIHPVKGIDILLHAFARIVKKGKADATLVVAGPDDGYLKECINIVKTHQLHNVIFAGQLGDSERIQAYFDADVVVVPSRYETFPMTILEAYACGRPVIATKVGGLKDLVIDDETGILVNVGNIEELSKALTRILYSGNFDEIAIRARNFVKQFSSESIVNRLELLYSNLSEEFSAQL